MATPYSPANVTVARQSGYALIDGLLSDADWGFHVWDGPVTYSFAGYNVDKSGVFQPHFGGALYSGGKDSYGVVLPYPNAAYARWTPLASQEVSAAVSALNAWANVADILFAYASDNATQAGDIRFSRTWDTSLNNTAFARAPEPTTFAGDIWLQPGTARDPQPGSHAYFAYLHEIGHALGLLHPHEAGMPAELDSLEYTVMSYRAWVGDDPGGTLPAGITYPTTPMLLDILAIQHLYGANVLSHAGNDSYSWDAGENLFETVWDSGGIDTLDWSNQSTGSIINLEGGYWSYLGPARVSGPNGETTTQNLALAFGTVIENAEGGSARDWIYGNGANNALNGNGGDDILYGWGGDDQLEGGSGNDIVCGGDGNDLLFGGFGSDWLDGGADDDSLDAGYTGIDVLVGGDGNDALNARSTATEEAPGQFRTVLLGGAGNDSITGSAGADWIDGGTGDDWMSGGPGNDVVIGGGGTDTVYGNSGDDVLIQGEGTGWLWGADGNDWVWGGTGNDQIFGGAGDDRLVGGAGDDIFHFDMADFSGYGYDVIFDFGNLGASQDVLRLTGVSPSAVSYVDVAQGTWLHTALADGGYGRIFAWWTTAAALSDDLLFA